MEHIWSLKTLSKGLEKLAPSGLKPDPDLTLPLKRCYLLASIKESELQRSDVNETMRALKVLKMGGFKILTFIIPTFMIPFAKKLPII